ncbi:FHIPEP family type III secretion protein [Candidatus Chlamydia corallus]|uniref:FHIPEP family type III secretion protein n=1 Tax=Candidatus Chlamydia corallus TaxID=2038470 RepID=UPI000C2FB981|nr:FHIPEP family type III secretion protein [Candidatus Chlamydia corallus]
MNKLLNFVSRTLGGEAALNMINKSSDLILALWMMGVVLMIIIPLPPPIVDLMITINLSISVFLLMVALYIPSALQLSVFPSLLLITTMFRLGINISSSRQILLKAYAGHVIQAFGDFVVGGNYVVGFIIFLIITIIQFIVVTKGAERVAEVAARFRLDAMPGKQMAIDADLRAGMIDATQARDKRAQIQKESELYGAMDGAMKFIKGDVIAGIVISLINIVGGLTIGVAMHGMDLAQAAHVYTLLSIGDGLVSQIPSLLIALTAGIVTTRVSSDKNTNLGKEISNQLVKEPRALLLAGAATLGVGFFKGFPLWSFSILALIFVALGILLMTKKSSAAKKGGGTGASTTVGAAGDGAATAGDNPDDYSLTLPVILELGKDLSKLIQHKTNTEGNPEIKGRRRQIAQEIAYEDSSSQVKHASTVVSNPKDIAVAIGYMPEKYKAPWIIAMGINLRAKRILDEAEKYGIPIMRNVPLAHQLLDEGKELKFIPESTYEAIGEILLYITSLNAQNPNNKNTNQPDHL